MADVTVSSAASSATVPASALLDALFGNAAVGVGLWDRELRFERINVELAAMNGLPVSEHLGRRPTELLPELGGRLEEVLRRVLDSGEAVRDIDMSGETPAAPGATRHWLANYFPVRDDDGVAVGVTGLVVEVTGERRADVRAQEAHQRTVSIDAELRALYSALPVGVAFLSPELRYLRVNETLAQLNGRSVDEHVGASLEEILGEHAAALGQSLRQVMATREPLEIELAVPLPHDPKDVRALEATYFPIVGGDEKLLGVGAAVRDVTDRHTLELEQSRLLQDALFARAEAEAARVRTDDAREEAERTSAEAERGRARMALLADAGRRMAESMDWETTLETVVRSVVPGIADWASLAMVEPNGTLRVHAIAHTDQRREQLAWELFHRYPPSLESPSGSGHVVRTGEMEVLADIGPDAIRAAARDAEQLRLMEALDFRHVVIAPLKSPQGVIGALSFVLGDSDRRFADGDIALIRSLATRAALHVENARLYTERSTIAHTLQASLLPQALPAIPGAEIAVRYLAAGDQNTVGGDFYDVFPTGEGVWTAVIGDVSGKGAPAAALTALARYSLRMAARLHDDPSANLGLLNDAFYDDTEGRDFCTVVYAQIRPVDEGLDLRLANGGHLLPLLVHVDGSVDVVEAGRGPLVGAVPHVAFEEATLHLAPGELMLLYTDGVTEVSTSDLALGERELRTTLSTLVGASAEDVVAAVGRRAVELQGGVARDDIALLAIKSGDAGPGEARVII